MAEASSSSAPSGDGEVLVRFVTQFAALRVPTAAIAVPGDLNRVGLSSVVSHLLGRGAWLRVTG